MREQKNERGIVNREMKKERKRGKEEGGRKRMKVGKSKRRDRRRDSPFFSLSFSFCLFCLFWVAEPKKRETLS